MLPRFCASSWLQLSIISTWLAFLGCCLKASIYTCWFAKYSMLLSEYGSFIQLPGVGGFALFPPKLQLKLEYICVSRKRAEAK